MSSLEKLKEIRLSNFVMGGTASIGATIVTNPIEVRNHLAYQRENLSFLMKHFITGYQNETSVTR